MSRPRPLQDFLDLVLPAMQVRAHDGDDRASLRIAGAVRQIGGSGAGAGALSVCIWFDPAWDRPVADADPAALPGALSRCWRHRSIPAHRFPLMLGGRFGSSLL